MSVEAIVILPSAEAVMLTLLPATKFLFVPPVTCPLVTLKVERKSTEERVVPVPLVGAVYVYVG